MKRRHFIAIASAIALAPMAVFAAEATLDYTPGLLKQNLAAGETVMLDYSASWCSTCKAQERVITRLRQTNPGYDKNIVFIKVDWDTYARKPISTKYKIPRRSTLVMLKGDKELGRIVAGTAKGQIKALLDLGVPAS